MLEKLENCPICQALLTQAEYDGQFHSDHWHTFPPIVVDDPFARARRAISALRQPDHSLARVPNTIRESIAGVIEDLIQRCK